MNTTMPINEENEAKLGQFVAQEIEIDGKIPHATLDAVEVLIKEAKKRAKIIDDKNDSFTLRLRDLGGVIRMAGDMAVMEKNPYITQEHVKIAVKKAISIEDQIIQRYETFENALQKDLTSSQQSINPHQKFQNENVDRSYM
jgi:ATP-dependent Lon protease